MENQIYFTADLRFDVGIDGTLANLHFLTLEDIYHAAFEKITQAGPNQLLLQDVHEVEEVFGLAAADVVDGIGRDGQAVVANRAGRGPLHHASGPMIIGCDII